MPYADPAKQTEYNRIKMKRYREMHPEYREQDRLRIKKIRAENTEYVQREKELKKQYILKQLSDPVKKQAIYEKNRLRRERRKSFCKDNNICHDRGLNCTSKSLPNHSLCEFHFFRECAKWHLKDESKWNELKILFEESNGFCYLSGIPIVLGLNAGLDHILPKNRGGSEFDISNLCWVDNQVNFAKNRLTNEEFIAMCDKIHYHNHRPINS